VRRTLSVILTTSLPPSSSSLLIPLLALLFLLPIPSSSPSYSLPLSLLPLNPSPHYFSSLIPLHPLPHYLRRERNKGEVVRRGEQGGREVEKRKKGER
jgi:hypothetical protein